MRAGARGYLLKGSGQDEIVRAVHAVGRGEAIFGPDIATRDVQLRNRSHGVPCPRRMRGVPESMWVWPQAFAGYVGFPNHEHFLHDLGGATRDPYSSSG